MNSWFSILIDKWIIIDVNVCTYIHINVCKYVHTHIYIYIYIYIYIFSLALYTNRHGSSYTPPAMSSTLSTQILASKYHSPLK